MFQSAQPGWKHGSKISLSLSLCVCTLCVCVCLKGIPNILHAQSIVEPVKPAHLSLTSPDRYTGYASTTISRHLQLHVYLGIQIISMGYGEVTFIVILWNPSLTIVSKNSDQRSQSWLQLQIVHCCSSGSSAP